MTTKRWYFGFWGIDATHSQLTADSEIATDAQVISRAIWVFATEDFG